MRGSSLSPLSRYAVFTRYAVGMALCFVGTIVHCGSSDDFSVSRTDDASSRDGASDSDAPSCSQQAKCVPAAAKVQIQPLDCLAKGWSSIAGRPSLPFYQPHVDATTINTVVYDADPIPLTNQFIVADGFDGPAYPIIPITTWRMSEFTGLFGVEDPVSDYQRGQVNVYGQSGVQVKGKKVGLWLNSEDSAAMLYAGSNSINSGCWYQGGPFAQMFPSTAHELDVSFTTGVATDVSFHNAHGQAYFQLIAIDTSGNCGQHCAFSYSIGFYSKDSNVGTSNGVAGDDTGTLGALPLAGSGLNATGWFRKMPDSIGYQTSVFTPALVHLRISPSEFMAIRAGVAAYSPSYAGLSTNPLDYGFSLLNVNGEVYDPCKDSRPTHPPCYSGDKSQLGLSVDDFRVTSIVPHEATGVPWAGDANGSITLYRDSAGHVASFRDIGETSGVSTSSLGLSALAAGNLSATPGSFSSVGDAQASADLFAVFRDAAGAVKGAWHSGSSWVSESVGTGAASDPTVFLDGNGSPRVVYRDGSQFIHEVVRTLSGFRDRALTSKLEEAAAPDATPVGLYAACSSERIVYRSATNHVTQIRRNGEAITLDDLSLLSNATDDVYSDPQPIVDAAGTLHVVFRDITGKIHLLSENEGVWSHTELSTPSGAVASLGSPRPFLAGCVLTLAYQGVDHHVHQLTFEGTWKHFDLSSVRGAQSTYDDVRGFTTSSGEVRIDYRGADGRLHEFVQGSNWLHRDF